MLVGKKFVGSKTILSVEIVLCFEKGGLLVGKKNLLVGKKNSRLKKKCRLEKKVFFG